MKNMILLIVMISLGYYIGQEPSFSNGESVSYGSDLNSTQSTSLARKRLSKEEKALLSEFYQEVYSRKVESSERKISSID
jgi:hypothetical protein